MRMDSNRIEELLKKYWACETSLEEERQLHEYFRSSVIPDSLKEAAVLFRYFDEQRRKETGATFDETLISKVQQASVRQSASPKQGGSVKKGKVVSFFNYSMRIAAGVAVLLAAIYLVRQELRSDKNVTEAGEFADTYDDPKEAYEETKKALMMISKGFGRAEQQAKKINMLNEAQEKISKTKEKEL